MGCCHGQQSISENTSLIKPNKMLFDQIKQQFLSHSNNSHKQIPLSNQSYLQKNQFYPQKNQSYLQKNQSYLQKNQFYPSTQIFSIVSKQNHKNSINKNNNKQQLNEDEIRHKFIKKQKRFVHGDIHPENGNQLIYSARNQSHRSNQMITQKLPIFNDKTNILNTNNNNYVNINSHRNKNLNLNAEYQNILYNASMINQIDISTIITKIHNKSLSAEKQNYPDTLGNDTERQFLIINDQIELMIPTIDNKEEDNQKIQKIWKQQKEDVLANKLKEDLHLNLDKFKHKDSVHLTDKQDTNDDDSYSRCLLSDPSRFLNESLLTERQKQKQLFYQQFNKINSNQSFLQWSDFARKSYQIKKQHILSVAYKKKYSPLATILAQAYRYFEMNKVNVISYNQSGWRIFFNGIKRLFPFQNQNHHLQSSMCEVFQKIHRPFLSSIPASEIIYNLTGWIPEQIVLQDINNTDGILQRLHKNLKQGNTIITFASKQQNKIFGLKKISLLKKQVTVYFFNENNQNKSTLEDYQLTMEWSKFVHTIKSIYVNWNPTIYEFVWKTQNVLETQQNNKETQDTDNKDSEYMQSLSNQFVLKIPPNSDDVELRMFLEVHYDLHNGKDLSDELLLELYDYNNGRVNSTKDCIRSIQKNKIIFSDVFVFESSNQKNQYTLVIRSKEKHIKKNIHYTFSIFSFFQIGFVKLSMEKIKTQKVIDTHISHINTGYGINSPYFMNNFYIKISVPAGIRFKIFAILPDQSSQFQLCMISNPNKKQNLTQLNLQTILNEIICTEQFMHTGYLQMDTKTDCYFFMINNYIPCQGKLRIIMQIIDRIPKRLIKSQNPIEPVKGQEVMIGYKQKQINQKAVFIKEFKWQALHSGPRKRLKSNTNSQFQNISVFKQFFNNPFIDYEVTDSETSYQFLVESLTYKKCFDEAVQIEDKQQLEPPTLSFSILGIGEEFKTFKIFHDDAFYVPFGFGFWSKVLRLQKGKYRFVFPKMEKERAIGKFTIFQIK